MQIESPYLVVELDPDKDPRASAERTGFDTKASQLLPGKPSALGLFSKIVVGRTNRTFDNLTVDEQAHVDLVTSSPDIIIGAILRSPEAASSLALLLRTGPNRTIEEGLLAESIHYSALQSSAIHQAWLRSRPAARNTALDQSDPPVLVELEQTTLRIILNRPDVHNALNSSMRNELLEALDVARADPSLRVALSGHGPSFCSGGDLREFGLATDAASAHLVRISANVGLMLSQVADRTTAFLHGSCIGAGIELPAFSRRIVAHPDTTFRLPELAFGLIPGAGGTVSIPRRIGRHRTMHMAVMGTEIDTATALDYGLIDAVSV